MTDLSPDLPDGITTCLFDLDGVLTRTAVVHAAAWQATFDAFLRRREGAGFRPFDPVADYDEYVDGRPRADGVRTFLASRGIRLPEGSADDPPQSDTVHGLGNHKNALLLRKIREQGVEAYPGSVRFLKAVRAARLRTAVVSSSANCKDVVAAAGLEPYLEVRVDGVVAAERGLPGKPHPDTFLEAARMLGARPAQAAVFEDALAGMDAGRSGHFGYVVGVDRTGQARALRAHGADIVVTDLADLLEDIRDHA
ncbi:beta-phosphoglucomutase family hydrolase [Streptomyces sp. P1-3]|uniref:beta-phosphoglucomutase family hydrolase n=1 Tax=Streptomyces sp. P1-3 TaxID=3421658 RepID=UPI003D36F884